MEDDRPVGQGLSVYRYGNAQSKGQGDENTLNIHCAGDNSFAIKVFKTERESMIMRITALIPIAFAILLISILTVQAYPFYYTMQDDKTSNHYASTPSVFYKGTCTLNFTLYSTATGSSYPFTLNPFWYSPDMQQVLYSPALNYYSNITCQKLQSVDAVGTKNSTTNMYESRTKILTSAITTNSWIKSTLECDPDVNNIIFLNNTNTPSDSYGNFPYAYGKIFGSACGLSGSMAGTITDAINWIKNGYYGTTCPTSPTYDLKVDAIDAKGCTLLGTGWTHGIRRFVAIPLNSQAGGLVNFSIAKVNMTTTKGYPSELCSYSTPQTTVYLWNKETDTYISYGSAPVTQILQLNRDTEYWIFIEQAIVGTGYFGDTCTDRYYGNSWNMSIWAYEPNLQCTAWGACTGGYQYRQCTDLNGILAPYVDQQLCTGIQPSVNVTLGFDTYTNTKVFYCSQVGISCGRSVEQRDRKVPTGWTRGGTYVTDSVTNETGWIEDYLDMSETEGFYYLQDTGTTETSLKMWYNPRKIYLPVWDSSTNTVVCNETTTGVFGSIYNDINASFWIARNITATTPYMSLSYRVRNCANDASSPETQTTGGFGCFAECTLLGTCYDIGVCNSTGIDLYTWNGCPEVPKSTIGIRLRDITSSTYPVYYSQTVTSPNFELGYREDRINGLNLNHTYELTLAVPPQNGVEDVNSYCVYIDDVKINFRQTALVCSSECDPTKDYNGDGIKDYTYIEATVMGADSCTIKEIEFDPRCVPAKLVADAQAMKDCTKNSTCDVETLVTIDCATQTYSYVTNSSYCIEEGKKIDSTQPMTGDVIINSVAIMFTIPAVIALLMSILISAIITGKVSTMFGQQTLSGGEGAGTIFIASFIAFLTAFTVAGLFPIWLYIVLALIAGVIASKLIGIW